MVLMRFAIGSILVATLFCRSYAAIIFESASLTQTGISAQDLFNGVPAVGVSPQVFTGVKFQLLVQTRISRIGGHFVANTIDGGEGSVFGAIVTLDDEIDFPDSSDLSSPDVLGSTLIPLPLLSSDASGALSLLVDPGWYAVVFGSELFGAEGFGGVLRNGADIGSPTYIGGQRNTIGFWRELPAMFINQRFFVEGFVIPEPSTAFFMLFGVGSLLAVRQRLFFSYK